MSPLLFFKAAAHVFLHNEDLCAKMFAKWLKFVWQSPREADNFVSLSVHGQGHRVNTQSDVPTAS